jgi:uncharacterized protein
MTPSEERRRIPFWSYEDLALVIGAVLPCYAFALVVRKFPFPNEGVRTVVFESFFYALMLGAMYLLIALRYGQPFWRSLGWTFAFRWVWAPIVAGPVLAIGLSALGIALRAPVEPVIQDLMTDRLSIAAVMIFGSLIGPVFEELVFRGFALPLLANSLGNPAGILLTAIPFALLHGTQYHWSWQSILIVGLTAVVLGYTRVKTGSTAAAALVHIGYNATFFAGFLAQKAL